MPERKTDKPGSLPQSLEETRYGNLDDTNILPTAKKSDIPGAFKCSPESANPEMQVRGLAPTPMGEMVTLTRRSISHQMSNIMDMVYEKNPHLAGRTPMLEYQLSHPDIEQYIEEIRTSRLRPVFDKYVAEIMTAPAASYPIQQNRSHDTHTGGWLLHNMIANKISKKFERLYPDMPPVEYTEEQRLIAVFLHDLHKLFRYKRVETNSGYTNVWVNRGVPAKGPVDYTLDLLRMADAKLFAEEFQPGIIHDPAKYDPLRYTLSEEDPHQGQDLEKTDLIAMKRFADRTAQRHALKMGTWDSLDENCAGCGERMQLYIPDDYKREAREQHHKMQQPNKPFYRCPTYDATTKKQSGCTMSMKLKDVQHMENEQFRRFIERILPYPAS